jgi:hypothetical protein
VSTGLYTTGPSRVQIFSIQHQFDSGSYEDDRTSWTRPSKTASVRLHYWNQPLADGVNEEEKNKPVQPEPPYHVFSRTQKWKVVLMIGVAGLFSGLSSNIYFPALDSIARVG